MASLPLPFLVIPNLRVRNGGHVEGERCVPEESAIAITINRTTFAVMLATPADIEDFALGFTLNENIIDKLSDIESLEIVPLPEGIEVRMNLSPTHQARLDQRERRLMGVSGCGLCGIESLAQALPTLPVLRQSKARFSTSQVMVAMAAMAPAQEINRATRAVHAAGFWRPGQGLVALREDIGRHNALDKLCGALVRQSTAAGDGIITLTSRVSLELVQKAARMGAPVIAAISAPSAHAVRLAQACNITLIAVAREDGFEVFSGAERLS